MRNNLSILFLLLVILSSCGTSKKSLIIKVDNLEKDNTKLLKQNRMLNKKVKLLKNTIEELESQQDSRLDIKPSIFIENNVKESSAIVSQLTEVEQYFNNDPSLGPKFNSFKQGGVEKELDVSYSDMQRVIKEAKTYVGTRHVMGGLSRSGIDCSGLLYVSFQANGITNVPRTAENFARYGKIILNTNDIQAGDLVFFTNTYRTSKLVTHAGICVGNGNFIHTSSSKGVMISKINDPYYWRKKFLFGTRIIN